MFMLLLFIGYLLAVVGIVALVVRAIKWGRFPLWETVAIMLGAIIVAVIHGLTIAGIERKWTDLLSLLEITKYNANQVQALATIFAGLIALVGIFLIVRQLKITERGLRQAARASLDMVRTEHNWKLFKHKVDPGLPGLPSRVLNEEYWRWRFVHLDHLSLLHTQWIDYDSGAISSKEIKGWICWAKHLILRELKADREDAEKKLGSADTQQIMAYDKTSPRLKALLHISELHNWDVYPHKFVQWLLKECGFGCLKLSRKE